MSAKEGIKLAAQRLFAEKGIDGVSVREIVAAAGLKNQGSLHYYFGTKEDLVKALVLDGSKLIDERRNSWLDDIESEGGPHCLQDITDVLIFPSTKMSPDGPYYEDSFTRFIVLMQQSHSQLFLDTLENRWNSGYQRCLTHLRRLMPAMPESVKNQRFIFMGAYLGSVLALREGVLAKGGRGVKTWYQEDTLQHFSQTMAAMLAAPLADGIFATGGASQTESRKRSVSTKKVSGPYGKFA